MEPYICGFPLVRLAVLVMASWGGKFINAAHCWLPGRVTSCWGCLSISLKGIAEFAYVGQAHAIHLTYNGASGKLVLATFVVLSCFSCDMPAYHYVT